MIRATSHLCMIIVKAKKRDIQGHFMDLHTKKQGISTLLSLLNKLFCR